MKIEKVRRSMKEPSGWGWPGRGAPVAMLVALYLLFAGTEDNSQQVSTTDWAMYLMHTQNLLAGRPYSQTPYVVHPETMLHGGFSYPPGYPLALAPVYAITGLNIPLLKVFTDALLVLSLWLIYLFLRGSLGPGTALLLLVMLGTGQNYLQMQGRLGSEGLYLLLSYAAIVTVSRFQEQGGFEARPWRTGLLAGLLFAASYLTRSVGLTLPLALGLQTLVAKRRIPRYLWAAALPVLAAILLNRALLHNEAAYKGQFVADPLRYVQNALICAGFFSHVFATPFSHLWRYLLWAPAMLLAAVAAVQRWRQGGQLADWYAAVMMAVLIVYYKPNSRYLLPLYPVFVLYLAEGWMWVNRGLGQEQLSRWIQPALATVLLVAPALNLWSFHQPPRVSLVGSPAFEELAGWVKSQGEAYTVFWNPRVLTLLTGRRAGPYPQRVPEEIAGFFNRAKPDYVVFQEGYEPDWKILGPVLEAHRGQLTSVWANSEFRVFRWRWQP